MVPENLVTRDAARTACIQDINEIAVHSHTVRELIVRVKNLLKPDISAIRWQDG